jgi:predicted alpha/beta-fold hydrolase
MPTIYHSTYQKPPLLHFNGHLQTILPSFRRVTGVTYTRERLTTPDDDFLNIDWMRQKSKRLVVLTHGLEGNTYRHYMLGMGKMFYKHGFDVLAWNCRSCGGEMNRQLRLYNHGETEDMSQIIHHAAQHADYQEIVLIGFSMGGNISLKYASVHPHPLVSKVIVFSAPLDMRTSIAVLDEPSNFIYKQNFINKLLPKIKYKAAHYPNHLDLNVLKGQKSIIAQAVLFFVNINGYQDMEDFYEKGSALHFIPRLQIPALIVQAQNDPILTPACSPTQLADKHPFIHLETPLCGGHVGFMHPIDKEHTWAEHRAIEFALA